MPLYRNTTSTRLLLDRKPAPYDALHYSCDPAGKKTPRGVPTDWLDVADKDETLPGIASAIKSGALVPYAGLSTADVSPAAPVEAPVVEAPVEAPVVEAPVEAPAETAGDEVAADSAEGGDRQHRRNRNRG